MKYFTTPAAEDLSLEEAYTLVCLRERCDIAGIIRNITPLIESIYAKISKTRWIEILHKLHDDGVVFYAKNTIILADPPFTYQNRNHAIAAMSALAALPPVILNAASKTIATVITRIGTEVKGAPIPMPSTLEAIATYALRCHRDAIGMPSECHTDAMPMHPHLNNINFNFNFNSISTSSSPLPPQKPQAFHRDPKGGGNAGGKPPTPPRRKEEEEERKDLPGGQAPHTPQDKRDWNGVLLSEQEAEKLLQKYPNLDLIDLTQEVADYYDLKAQEIKHPYQACVKWAENKLKKEAK